MDEYGEQLEMTTRIGTPVGLTVHDFGRNW